MYHDHMAHVHQVPEDEARGLLAQLYAAGRARAGSVANIIRVMSLDPPSAHASIGLYLSVMKSPNALSPARREMLGAVVSNINGCYY